MPGDTIQPWALRNVWAKAPQLGSDDLYWHRVTSTAAPVFTACGLKIATDELRAFNGSPVSTTPNCKKCEAK